MNREEALAVWAPEDSPWSPWVNTVLFSFIPAEIPDVPPSLGGAWKVPLTNGVALMIESSGAGGVELGVSLAHSGYRPIPLYNACPHPINTDAPDEASRARHGTATTPAGVPSVIDVVPILRALERGTGTLKSIPLPPLAPPAFLLDANRRRSELSPGAGWFDNRSIIRESDLPSAAFLKARGIDRIVLLQAKRELQSDLRVVLLSWQKDGVALFRQAPATPWNPHGFTLSKPSRLKNFWDKLALQFGYRVNRAGSFGHFEHGSAG